MGADFKVTRSKWFTYYSDTSGNEYYLVDFEEFSKEEYEKAYQEDAPDFVSEHLIKDSDIMAAGKKTSLLFNRKEEPLCM